ncbi:MAG: methyltransferase domain-containing protein [Candidatus Delongbacteria bacterium]|jgi:SAM-dependent methyltransferase|nr:methyltransferase domain-containing protein [Candidatus Delongbacteria bacterium]
MFLKTNSRRPVVWPKIEKELEPFQKYFKGKILNAGSGNRDISSIVEGELFNLDLPMGSHNSNIHIKSTLEKIPVTNEFFDVIICNAVLEHVENVNLVMDEFFRVLKPGGYLYICIPFMQPVHNDPKDYRRYTSDGLIQLLEKYNFSVIDLKSIHSVYHTLGWIIHEWLSSEKSVIYWLLKQILYPIIKYKTKVSRKTVTSISSAFGAISQKNK